MRDGVHLIAYADRLGGSLDGLRVLLEGPFAGVFAGVHVLPFFTPFDGADAGFDPADHMAVDPRLGSWDDIRRLARTHEVTADAIVNHISAESAAFQDWLARGDASPASAMFLTYDRVYPQGATEAELLRTYRPRPGLPFTVFVVRGRPRLVWTTFTGRQIDMDLRAPAARAYVRDVLGRLAAAGVTVARLDAVGYVAKTPGSDKLMTDETLGMIDELTADAHAAGLEVLAEVHSSWRRDALVAGHVDRVYDFALGPLILYAVTTGDGAPLSRWWARRPANAVTVLDTHDGIGLADVAADPGTSEGALLTPAQTAALAERIEAASGGTSVRAIGAYGDLYQVDCTIFDAVGRDDRRCLLARALQLFTPGIPQAYYVGLLAGANDVALARRSGEGRDVNRHHYTPGEVADALGRPVVRRQLELLRARAHPAFGGDWAHEGTASRPRLTFSAPGAQARLDADLRTGDWEVTLRDAGGERRLRAGDD